MEHIILIGFMGAGKTSVGKELAKCLDRRFVDTDVLIEAQQQRKISDIFAKEGEAFFRALETETLKNLCGERELLAIAVGGGLPMQEENQPLLRELGMVVYLKATVETLLSRLAGDRSRPKLQGGDLQGQIESLMRQRLATYQSLAQAEIVTDGKTPEEVALEIKGLL